MACRSDLPPISLLGAAATMTSVYYLDDRLSVAESTCRFPANGSGRENAQEAFYAVAIRRVGERETLFRFSEHDLAGARSMVKALNRLPQAPG